MRFETQRYVSGIGWSHEAYARTEEEAKVIGRQRVGAFDHRWQVRPLLGASRNTGNNPGKPAREKTKKTKKKKSTQARVVDSRAKVRKEVTDYNRSAPTLRKPAKEDPNRTEEEVRLAAEIASSCAARGRARPGRLGFLRRDALVAWLEQFGEQKD